MISILYCCKPVWSMEGGFKWTGKKKSQPLESHAITQDYRKALRFLWFSLFIVQIKQPRTFECTGDLPDIFLLVNDQDGIRRWVIFPAAPYFLTFCLFGALHFIFGCSFFTWWVLHWCLKECTRVALHGPTHRAGQGSLCVSGTVMFKTQLESFSKYLTWLPVLCVLPGGEIDPD